MSLPPPTTPAGFREYVLELAAPRSWGRKSRSIDLLRLSAMGASITFERSLRSPLGAPAIYGLLFRVADTVKAENTFRQFGLLRPVTDREVPPTLRRALPSDRPADPKLVTGAAARSATSVAPPGRG